MKIKASIKPRCENCKIIRRKGVLRIISAEIRKYRKPEPYKGKGIKYAGEIVRRKQGKKTGK